MADDFVDRCAHGLGVTREPQESDVAGGTKGDVLLHTRILEGAPYHLLHQQISYPYALIPFVSDTHHGTSLGVTG